MKRYLIFLLVFAAPCCVFAESTSLLIIPFDNSTQRTDWDGLETEIPDLMMAYLSPYSDQIKLVDRESLDDLAAEAGLGWEGYMKANTMASVGSSLQATTILRGSFTLEKGQFTIRSFLYETETTHLLKSFEQQATARDIPTPIGKLADQVGFFLCHEKRVRSDLPVDENPEVNKHFIYGWGYFYNGRYTKAIPEFLKILEREPGNLQARYWLGRTYFSSELKDHAKIEFERFLKDFPVNDKSAEVKAMLATMVVK